MKPIDLTTQPPRSPYQKMEGLYMMPRTIDKLRAKLPGGKIGAYSITTAFGPGLSLMLLDDIGVTEKCLLEIVQKVSVEHEIADWLRRNADLSSVTSLNEKLFSPRIEDVLAFIPVATFNEIYPAAERMTITSPMFEVLLEDDRLMFPSHFQNGSAGKNCMTPKQKQLVQITWEKVLPISETAATLFYGRLFELDPSTRPLFKHTNMPEQRKKLMHVIGMAVDGLNRLDQLIPVVSNLGRRHRGYGVTDEHYSSVGRALIWTLEQGLSADFTPEVREAWATVYAVLADTMKNATARADAAACTSMVRRTRSMI